MLAVALDDGEVIAVVLDEGSESFFIEVPRLDPLANQGERRPITSMWVGQVASGDVYEEANLHSRSI